MSRWDDVDLEMRDLIAAYCDGQATAEQIEQLESSLESSPSGQRLLLDALQIDAELHFLTRGDHALSQALETLHSSTEAVAVKMSSPPLTTSRSASMLGFLHTLLRAGSKANASAAAFWVTMLLFVGTLTGMILVVVLLVRGVHLHVDGKEDEGRKVAAAEKHVEGNGWSVKGEGQGKSASSNPQSPVVARLASTADCHWADVANAPKLNDPLPIGRKLELKSGLAEIVYQSGAKVLLQGPAEFDVHSTSSGYLTRGKLTVTVEEPLARGFAICTSGMKFTDLGTQFGVMVAQNGAQEVAVFRGTVLAEADDSKSEASNPKSPTLNPSSPTTDHRPSATIILKANESLRIEKPQGNPSPVIVRQAAKPDQFVRQMPSVAAPASLVTDLDLVDVMAGGDGLTGRRNRAIDPSNGQFDDELHDAKVTLPNKHVPFQADHQYHRVPSASLIDGVFTLPGGEPAQLDSAGHLYVGFPHTPGETTDPIRAIGATTSGPAALGSNNEQRLLPKFGSVNYTSLGHGMLYMRGKKGITFDLEGIRRAHPQYSLLAFTAVAGNPATPGGGQGYYADFWVFVDGQLLFQRRHVASADGEIRIKITLAPANRFLTLATSPSGNGVRGEMPLFCDPRLKLGQVAGDSNDAAKATNLTGRPSEQ